MTTIIAKFLSVIAKTVQYDVHKRSLRHFYYRRLLIEKQRYKESSELPSN